MFVSIRAPAWGATSALYIQRQNYEVSIRAPAWGATIGSNVTCFKLGVSIRAPAWGATKERRPLGTGSEFQFALPRGERPSLQGIL